MIRVAFLNREPSAYPGGDVLSIVDLIEALHPLGVEAEYIYGHWSPSDLERFDLVHIRHVNFAWSQINFDGVVKSGKPYVVTPCFYPSVHLGASGEVMQGWLANARAVLPFTCKEREVMKEFFSGWEHCRTRVIPSGTHLRFHHSENQVRDGVLVVSPRTGSKNEAVVREIVKGLGLPFIMATNIPHVLMPSIYAHAKVFVNASESDRMSRTIGEALCAGCRVLATTENWGNEWYGDGLYEITPIRASIMAGIKEAYDTLDWDYSPNAEARKLTWARAAEQVKKVYEEVLSGRYAPAVLGTR